MKILCLTDNEFIYVYELKSNGKILDELNDKYGTIKKDTQVCTYHGGMISSYGKYQSETDDYRIVNVTSGEVVDNCQLNPEAVLGEERKFLTPLEIDMRTFRVGGPQKVSDELTILYYPELYKIYKSLVNSGNTVDLISYNDLVKYYNRVNGIPNNLKYDTTLFSEEHKKINMVYSSIEQYNDTVHKDREKYNDKLEVSEKEQSMTNKEFFSLFKKYVNGLKMTRIGVVPVKKINIAEVEILNRFALSNNNLSPEMHDYLVTKLNEKTDRNDFNDAAIRKILRYAYNNYDLDGEKQKDKIAEYVAQEKENDKTLKFLDSVAKKHAKSRKLNSWYDD